MVSIQVRSQKRFVGVGRVGDPMFLVALGLDVLDALVVYSRRHVVIGIAVLAVVKLFAHHVVQASASEVQDLLEGLAEVSV